MKKLILLSAVSASLLLLQGCATTESYAPERDTGLIYEVTDSNAADDELATFCPREPDEIYMVMPEGDGKVGIVDITFNSGEEQVIEGEYATVVLHADKTAKFKASKKEAALWFAEVASVLPKAALYRTLYFKNGTTQLTPESRQIAKGIYKAIQKRDIVSIVIEGHADTTASKEFNEKLSLARAEKVSDKLVSMGVNKERIKIKGFGERQLLIKTNDNVSEQQNRRVEVNIR